jgi:hypothetical protein
MEKTPAGEKQNVMFCILCQAKVKAIKVLAQAMKVAEILTRRKSAGNGSVAKKKVKCLRAPTAIIHKLHQLATFQSQLYIFTKVEKTKADVRFALIEDHFHGNDQKHIQGACTQLLEGAGAFRSLYNHMEGETNVELNLKPSCYGKYYLSIYAAGVHFTAEDINTFGINKKIKGRALWAMGLTVLQSIKKALSIVPKLSPRIVLIDKNCVVVGYASGKNESLFMQHINNGMFALMAKDGNTLLVEGDASDDNDKILGSTSEEGMPMMRDNVLIDCMRVPAVKGSLNETSFDDVVVVDSMALNTWDPFGGIAAPSGYTYIGKLAFICFGPTSKFFASTLTMREQSERSVAEKKEGLMRAMRKITKEQTDNQEIGIDRGMTMQA